jgi:hypothetical protein
MSEAEAASVEAIRRRYAAVFGTPVEQLADEPLPKLRAILQDVEEQHRIYAEMGFEVEPEVGAAD